MSRGHVTGAKHEAKPRQATIERLRQFGEQIQRENAQRVREQLAQQKGKGN